jgi:hypothetical protein
MADRDHFTESAPELPTPLSVLYSVVDDAQRYSDYLENAQGSYEMKPTGGPSEPRLYLPSGWPTAEFSNVLANKACSTSENFPSTH